VCGRRLGGGLFFRDFLLAEQKKVTQGAGAEQPAISFSIRRRRHNEKAAQGAALLFKPWTPAFAGVTT